MTTSVYIKYPSDPSVPWNWQVFDADTDKQLMNLHGVHIRVNVNATTMVDLVWATGSATQAYLRPAPVLQTGGVVKGVSKQGDIVFDNKPKAVVHCPECAGAGHYTSPVTGRRSPCSKGCKAKP